MNRLFTKLIRLVTAALLLAPVLCYSAGQQQVAAALDCDRLVHVHCGKTPSAVMTSGQQLWVVFVQQEHVYFTTSDDLGASYSPAVAINKQPEKIYSNGENRAKVAIGKRGEVLVSWSKNTQGKFTGDIRFSRSVNGGKSFESPFTVNNDGLLATHRFDSLQVTPSGKIYLAWIDKRDRVAAIKNDNSYTGAALYYAVSSDGGVSFPDNYKVADSSCECCRIAIAAHGDDEVAVLWRHIFPGSIRDHAAGILKPKGDSFYQRATVDNWQINACPHHGPDMIQATNTAANSSTNTSINTTIKSPVAGDSNHSSRYHIVWFSNGDDHQGIYYALQDFATGEQSQLYRIDDQASASHPQLAQRGNRLYIVWKIFDGEKTHIRLIVSEDHGQSFVDKGEVLSTRAGSDHPLLIEANDGVYLSWHTSEQGYRIEAL
jgi:hypothetical protein